MKWKILIRGVNDSSWFGFYQSILHLNRLRKLGTFSLDSDRLIGWYCSKLTFDFVVGDQVALLNELVVMNLLVGERER